MLPPSLAIIVQKTFSLHPHHLLLIPLPPTLQIAYRLAAVISKNSTTAAITIATAAAIFFHDTGAIPVEHPSDHCTGNGTPRPGSDTP